MSGAGATFCTRTDAYSNAKGAAVFTRRPPNPPASPECYTSLPAPDAKAYRAWPDIFDLFLNIPPCGCRTSPDLRLPTTRACSLSLTPVVLFPSSQQPPQLSSFATRRVTEGSIQPMASSRSTSYKVKKATIPVSPAPRRQTGARGVAAKPTRAYNHNKLSESYKL